MTKIKKNTVLVVDDESSNIIALTNALSAEYTVRAATNGRDALKTAEKHLPDVILLDIVMPEMDGYAVITELKKSDKTKDIPVIFLTAMTDPENEAKGFALGAVDYMFKPCSQELLLSRIELHLRLKHCESTLKKIAGETIRDLATLRLQIFSIIIALAILIIAIGVGVGTSMMRKGIIKFEDDGLNIVADLTDALVSSKLDFLKVEAQKIALDIDLAAKEDIGEILRKYSNTNIGTHDDTAHFSALTILERTSEGEKEKIVIAASHGDYPVPEILLLQTNNFPEAFNGYSVLSTTIEVDKNADGTSKLVFYVSVPIGEIHEGQARRILCAALDGMYFNDLLRTFRVWDNEGDIVLCDGEGNVIATIFHDISVRRINYIQDTQLHPELQSLADFFSLMVEGKSGRHVHTLRGQQRVGFYRPITGSRMGWALGVTAPVVSSPYWEALRGIVVIALVCLVISAMVAFFVSGFLVKPFKEALQAKEIAEEASESKSAFLANVSHELRTPLNAIIGLSELAIGSEDAKGEVAVNLEKIYNSGMTLLGTVNDLLDISKIEAGKFELILAKYDLPSLINDTVALNSVRIGSKPIKFTLEVDENLPDHLFGDELRIKQVLNNLLSNAFKYTQKGHVNWSVTGEHEGDKFFLVFKISDTGIGIRPESIALLFTEYHQVDSKANRKIEGTGLGLALVKKMAMLMGGTISVESVFGRGSTFTLRIQQEPLSDEVIGTDVAFNLIHMRHSQSKLARNALLTRLKLPYARVLIVDDVQTNLDVARGMLKPYEMQVDCITSGQGAIDAVRDDSVRYNAIFMDHMMPGMDGIEAAKRIRQIGTEYAKSVPIIALTANAIVGTEEMFLKSGFQAFLSKPIDIMRLDAAIRRWVRDRAQEATLNAGTDLSPDVVAAGQQQSWRIDGVDKEKALEQFGNNEETYLIILQSFVMYTPDLLDQIRTYVESRLKDYALAIHGIKGTCYGIHADAVGKQAEALEIAARREDFRYISEHNAEFIKAAEELIKRISAVLKELEISE